jgi:hypothetical protein
MPVLLLWAVCRGCRKRGLLPTPRRPLSRLAVSQHKLEECMKKLLLSGAVVAFAATAAYAQTNEFYVVRDTTTKTCTIVVP